jgi:hypothetical protein
MAAHAKLPNFQIAISSAPCCDVAPAAEGSHGRV